MKNFNSGKCECGQELNFRPTPFYSNEQRRCPKCGKLHKVDRDLEDWRTIDLPEYVAYYPTPLACGWGNAGAKAILDRRVKDGTITEDTKKKMTRGNGGKLNPTWVEWLMSFPTGWTYLDV